MRPDSLRSKTLKHSLMTSFHDCVFSLVAFMTSQNFKVYRWNTSSLNHHELFTSSKSIWWLPLLSASRINISTSICFGSMPRFVMALSNSSSPIAPLLSASNMLKTCAEFFIPHLQLSPNLSVLHQLLGRVFVKFGDQRDVAAVLGVVLGVELALNGADTFTTFPVLLVKWMGLGKEVYDWSGRCPACDCGGTSSGPIPYPTFSATVDVATGEGNNNNLVLLGVWNGRRSWTICGGICWFKNAKFLGLCWRTARHRICCTTAVGGTTKNGIFRMFLCHGIQHFHFCQWIMDALVSRHKQWIRRPFQGCSIRPW